MSADRDVTRVVRSWFHEDAHEDADRVLNLVLDELDTTPQRRANWLARRFPVMNSSFIRYGVAAVVIVAVAILGLNLVTKDVGGPPAATQTPTPSPSPSAEPTSIHDGLLSAGTYSLDSALRITFELPAGWSGCCGASGIAKEERPGLFSGILYSNITEIIVYGDPCNWAQTTTTEPRGAEAIAAALASQPGRDGTEPARVNVGGVAGLHVRLTVPLDLATTPQPDGDVNFIDCDEQLYASWTTAALAPDPDRYHQGLGQIDDLYIVDIGDQTVVFDVMSFEETSASDRAALDAIVASIRIN